MSGEGYLAEQVSDVSVAEAVTRCEEAFAADIRVPARRHELSGVDGGLILVEMATNSFTGTAAGG